MSFQVPFHCGVCYSDGAWVIALSGELDIATVPEVEAPLTVVRAFEGDVTLDLRRLDFMDVSGIRLILELNAAARSYGFELRVLVQSGGVRRVMAVTGVDESVNIVTTSWPLGPDPRTEYAVIATDITGLITLWNEEAERLYGWSALEVLGRPIRELMVGPQDRHVAEEILNRVERDGYWEGEFDVMTRAGRQIRVHVRDALVTDLDGSFLGFAGVSAARSQPVLTPGAAKRGRRRLVSVPNIGPGFDWRHRQTRMSPADFPSCDPMRARNELEN